MQFGIVDCDLKVRDEACFYLARDLGLTCLEMSIDRVGDPTRLIFQANARKLMKEMTSESGVRVSAVQCCSLLQDDIFSECGDVRLSTLASIEHIFARAHELSIPTIVMPMFGQSDLAERIGMPEIMLSLQRLATLAHEHDVDVAIQSLCSATTLNMLLSELDEPRMGICFDPANLSAIGLDPLTELLALKSSIKLVHLKNRTMRGELTGLFEGTCRIEPMLSEINHLDLRCDMIIEQSGATNLESLRHEVEHLHSCVQDTMMSAAA